jgi:hypothetical protein
VAWRLEFSRNFFSQRLSGSICPRFFLVSIYRTEDGGHSWQPLGGDLPMVPSVSRAAYGISLHPHQPDTLFYGSDIDAETARIFVSLDRGEQWQPLSADLPKLWLLCAG